MKIKKFTASSMADAMKSIREELGDDAVILNSRVTYTGGFLGLFRKKSFEVIAAVDEMEKREAGSLERRIKQPPPAKFETKREAAKGNLTKAFEEEKKAPHTEQAVMDEIKELKNMLKNLTGPGDEFVYPAPLQNVYRIMTEQEIDQSVKKEIMGSLLEKWFQANTNANANEVLSWSKELLQNRISHLPFGEITFKKKFVNVVGPTGVGKTTTLAKIAGDCILKFNKKVGLITTDTYRIAAIEQLKTYAKILSIPLEVCYNIDDFKKSCEKFKDFDVVLIDTAGRNFRNKQYVEDLKEVIDFNMDVETFLVLSLTAKQKDMEEIYEQFSSIPISQFIFTKIDETSNYGSMYNMIDKYQKGVAYITNGQNVPDDRLPASAQMIANLIFEVEEQ